MNVTFHVVDGAKAGQVTLATPVSIGRGRETKLTLPLPLISRNHCEVFEQAGGLWIRDLGSTNGTRVGGDRIGAPTPLDSGQQFSVGSVTLRVEFNASQDAGLTPTADYSASIEPLDGDVASTVDHMGAAVDDSAADPPTPDFTAGDPMAAVEPQPQQPVAPDPAPQQPPGAIPMAMPIEPAAPVDPPVEPAAGDAPADDDLDDFLNKFN